MALKVIGKPGAAPAAKAVAAKPAAAPGKAVTKTAPAPVEQEQTLAETHLLVHRSIKNNQTGETTDLPGEDQVLEVHKFATAHATTSVSMGLTKDLGGYNSLKTGVMISRPHYAEEGDEAIQAIINKAAEALDAACAVSEGMVTGGEAVDADAQTAVVEGAAEEGAAEEGAAEEGGIGVEQIRAMSREELTALIEQNEDIGIDPNDYAEDAELAEAVIVAAGLGEEAPADEATEVEGYTEEQLKEATLPQLKEIMVAWGMDAEIATCFKGPPPAQKSKAIKAILAAQTPTE